MLDGEISVGDPKSEDVRRLLERHLEFARLNTPPEDIHALGAEALADPDVTLYGLRVGGELVAVGALRRLDAGHAELKSMHTVDAARGRGIGRAMLDHLMRVARARGYRRISLETGCLPGFAPARALYASAGFARCGPFGDYGPSPNSVFMTRSLDPPGA